MIDEEYSKKPKSHKQNSGVPMAGVFGGCTEKGLQDGEKRCRRLCIILGRAEFGLLSSTRKHRVVIQYAENMESFGRSMM